MDFINLQYQIYIKNDASCPQLGEKTQQKISLKEDFRQKYVFFVELRLEGEMRLQTLVLIVRIGVL